MQYHFMSSRPEWPQLDSQAVAAREHKDPSLQPLMFGEGMFAPASLDGSFDPPVLRQHEVPPQLRMFDMQSHAYSVHTQDISQRQHEHESRCAEGCRTCGCCWTPDKTGTSPAGDVITHTGICTICDTGCSLTDCCQPLIDCCALLEGVCSCFNLFFGK
jgi:hypothetical protein